MSKSMKHLLRWQTETHMYSCRAMQIPQIIKMIVTTTTATTIALTPTATTFSSLRSVLFSIWEI